MYPSAPSQTAPRHIALGAYDTSGDRTVLLSDVLAGEVAPDAIEPGDAVIALWDGAQVYLREVWNFGDLEHITRQLALVRARLAAGQVALLRSTFLDELKVPFLHWAPDAAGHTAVTTFFVTETESNAIFPDGADSDTLYAHVAAAWEQLERRPVCVLPTSALVTDLDAALAEAQRFLSL